MLYHDKTYKIAPENLAVFGEELSQSIRGALIALPSMTDEDVQCLDRALGEMRDSVSQWASYHNLNVPMSFLVFSREDTVANARFNVDLDSAKGEMRLRAYMNQSSNWHTPETAYATAMRMIVIAGALSGVIRMFDKLGSKYLQT